MSRQANQRQGKRASESESLRESEEASSYATRRCRCSGDWGVLVIQNMHRRREA